MQKAWYVDYDENGALWIRTNTSPHWDDFGEPKGWCSACIHGKIDTEPGAKNNLCESCARKFGYIW